MDRIIISIHSMVDLITNSSTELFVLDTDKSLDVINEILQDMVSLHNNINNLELSVDQIFDEPYISNGGSVEGWGYKLKEGDIVIQGCSDNSIPFWMFELLEDNFTTNRYHLG